MEALKGNPRLGQYLRQLRQGYGYSLRKVEEMARSDGGEIDNSQLSRYEKGVCYPSFDKLRTLANVFNVSVQTFADVIDLENFENLATETDDVEALLESGKAEFNVGAFGRAYGFFHAAQEVIDRAPGNGVEKIEGRARARLNGAIALARLGKLGLAEKELRQVLRDERRTDVSTVAKVLLQLSNIHEEQGENYLAEIEAQRALDMARKAADSRNEGMAHHALGRVLQDRGRLDEALPHHHAALAYYQAEGIRFDYLKVKVNLGALYCGKGKFREGVRILSEARDEGKREGFRWIAALGGTWLAEVHFRRGEHARARKFMRESNAIASSGEVKYQDILFLNAFYLWKISLSEGNTAQSKIAFGRLKYLRSSLERMLPEVREFDLYIQEKGGAR